MAHQAVSDELSPSVEKSVERLNGLADRMAQALATPSESDERLSKVEAAVKWASPWRQLIGFAAFLIVGGVAVYTAMLDYARVQVIETVREAHSDAETPLEPSVQTVVKLQEDVGSVKKGVDALVAEKDQRRKIREVEIELELHVKQYDELVQEWSLKKASGRRVGDKPSKGDRYIELEAQRKRLSLEKL